MKHTLYTKNTKTLWNQTLLGLGLLVLGTASASAQFSIKNRGLQPGADPRNVNPARIKFTDNKPYRLADPAKLIEIGPIKDERHINLLLLIGGKDKNDYQRKLEITHWDGSQLINDASIDFTGWSVEPLLLGRFNHPSKPPENAAPATPTPPPAKGKKPVAPPPSRQIAVAGGIYSWTGGTFKMVCAPPPNLKMALILDGTPDQMMTNSGDNASLWELVDDQKQQSSFTLMRKDPSPGYPKNGLGTQHFDGDTDFKPGIRYIQTYWNGNFRWMICLQRGKALDNKDYPDATINDQLVVYVPKAINKDKSFWQLTSAEDYEETWRSQAFPGRVLDVRVGDVKGNGAPEIVVLVAKDTDNDHPSDRYLYFFDPDTTQATFH